jgi:predicted RNA-binding protein (virulence factor B family)
MNLGEINILNVARFSSPGAYLVDDEGNDVLLPGKYIPEGLTEGDTITVFLYKDSEDRLVATTETPKLMLHGFSYLNVKEVSLYGAFLDWGLEKDLMVPFKEQNQRMEEGKSYLVTLQMDHATDRLFASMKTSRFLKLCEDHSITGKEVEVLICDKTDLGVKVIVDDIYQGIKVIYDVVAGTQFIELFADEIAIHLVLISIKFICDLSTGLHKLALIVENIAH